MNRPWGESVRGVGGLGAGLAAAAVVGLLAMLPSPAAGQSGVGVDLVTADAGNEARYRVREQLARIEFPSDAVGVTGSVRGTLVLREGGEVRREGSRFVIDLTTIRSDSDRRDNYVRRNTLRTEHHPEAVFVPTRLEGLGSSIPTTGTFGDFDMSIPRVASVLSVTDRIRLEYDFHLVAASSP